MYLTPEEHTALLKSRREAQVQADHFKAALIRIKRGAAFDEPKMIASIALENVPYSK